MSAKKLLGVKIAAVAALLLAVASWLYSSSLAARRRCRPWDGGSAGVDAAYRRAAKAYGPPGRHTPANWKARELDDLNRLARGEPVAVYFRLLKHGPPDYEEASRYSRILCWRCLLGPGARAEYARRCQQRAEQEWAWWEADSGSCCPPRELMGFLTTAYNVADAPLDRQAIARRFHGFRLWARQLQASRMREQWGITRPIIADYALLDWERLGGGAAAAIVPDPLAAAQPGTR